MSICLTTNSNKYFVSPPIAIPTWENSIGTHNKIWMISFYDKFNKKQKYKSYIYGSNKLIDNKIQQMVKKTLYRNMYLFVQIHNYPNDIEKLELDEIINVMTIDQLDAYLISEGEKHYQQQYIQNS